MKGTVTAFLVRLATGIRLAEGLPLPERSRIYFANHSSHLDFVAIWAALPPRLRMRVRPVAALDYWGKGAIRRWIASRVFHAVLITRDPAQMRRDNPVERMQEALSDGADLILFPEGTRSEDGIIGPFKPGFHHLAERNPDLELMPVYLQNLNRILPKGEGIPTPLICSIRFGNPIDRPHTGENRESFLHRAKDAVISLSQGNLTRSTDD